MPQEERPKLSLFSSIYVDRELLPWLPTFFAQEAIIQVINAEKLCDWLSEKLGGKPDLKCRERKSADEILGVLDTIYVPEGRDPSRWNGAREFIEFAKKYGKTDVCFGTGDETGLTLETPFGEDTALIRLHSDVLHPQLGSGLLATVQIPFQSEAADVEKTSALLNFLEARQWTDIPQLGCWHPHEIADGRMGLAHASFVPNVLYKDGLATNFAIWSLGRVRWARQELWPRLQDKPMLEILTSRMEALANAAEKGNKKPN